MKKIISLVLIAIFMFCAASCGKDGGDSATTAATPVDATTASVSETTAEATTLAETTAEATTLAETTAEATTLAETTAEATTLAETTTKAATTVKATTKAATTAKATTKAATTAAAKTPATTEEILKVFNSATQKAVSSKAGFTKKRTTTISSFSPDNIFKLPIVGDTVKEVVYDFLGVGTISSTTAKGKVNDPAALKTSTLKAADISSATCTLKDGNYEITLKLKNGKGTNSSAAATALDRSPICTGKGDKKEFDHKTAENIYTGITGADASVKAVSESYSNAVIKATVNAKSGQLTKLTVSFNFSVNLSEVKYVVKIGDCSGKASTKVEYTSFKY